MWDESTLAFVYNYGTDKEPKNFTTSSFDAIMIPRPHEALIIWSYPCASFCAVDSFFNAQGQLIPEDTLGVVYFALDPITFFQKGGSENRTYKASENIVSVSFTPIDGNQAPVRCVLDAEKETIGFVPDTTKSKKWRDFQSSTGVKRENVEGFLSLTDVRGVTSSVPVSMAWFNTYHLDVELNVSQDDQALVKGNEPYYQYNLTDKFLELGLDDDLLKDTRYGLLDQKYPLTSQDISEGYESMGVTWTDIDSRAVKLTFDSLSDIAPGKKHRYHGRMRISVNPSSTTPNFTPTQVLLTYCITVNFTN